jgi:hypothetical protein
MTSTRMLNKKWPKFKSRFLNRVVEELWGSRKSFMNLCGIECISNNDNHGEWLEIRLQVYNKVLVIISLGDDQASTTSVHSRVGNQRLVHKTGTAMMVGNSRTIVRYLVEAATIATTIDSAGNYAGAISGALQRTSLRINDA